MVAASTFAWREARQRWVADDNARRADEAHQTALRETYQARMEAAQSALDDHFLDQVARHLRAAPEKLRGWEWHHLWTRLDESIAVFDKTGPGGYAKLVPGNALRFFTVEDRKVALWNADTGLCEQRFPDADDAWGLSVRNGSLLFLCEGADLVLFDKEGTRKQTFKAPERWTVVDVAVSPDGATLAVIWSKQYIEDFIGLFDIASGRLERPLLYRGARCRCLRYSPDGKTIAVGSVHGDIYLWDAASKNMLPALKGHAKSVNSLCFSPDSRHLLSGSSDLSVRQWDVQTGRQIDIRRGHRAAVWTVSYSPDGRWLASASASTAVRIAKADRDDEERVLHGHTKDVTQLAYVAGGEKLASVNGGTVRLWNTGREADPRVLRGHTSYVYGLAISPDGRTIASGGWDNAVRIWDAASGEQIAALPPLPGYVAALAISPDGTRLAGLVNGGALRIWNLATGKELKVLKGPSMFSPGLPHRISFSPDGRTLAAGGVHCIHLFDVETGTEKAFLPVPGVLVRIAAFGPDGSRLAAGGRMGGIDIFDVESGVVIQQMPVPGFVTDVVFSADGGRIATASTDRTVRLWDMATGEERAVLRGHTNDDVFAVAFHPDGSRIASGGRDQVLRIWDTQTSQEVAHLPGHTDYVFTLAWSADGNTLVSASGDTTVRIWDTRTVLERYRARRELSALEPEAKRLLDKWLAEDDDPAKLGRRIETDSSLSETWRRAVQIAWLRRCLSGKLMPQPSSTPR
jgi:WD40 repeat protein